MIPKIIHYIWLGGNPLPEIVEKCIESWKKYCPDYEIKRWDESNLDIDFCRYCREAYDSKKYAFASDVLRFKILKEYGGIYLDVDVELLKSLDDLLENKCFMGFEKWGSNIAVAPGLVIGAEKGHTFLNDMIENYKKSYFLKTNGDIDYETVCKKTTDYLVDKYNLKIDNTFQKFDDMTIYPAEYFCPMDGGEMKDLYLTENTYSRHLYIGSWVEKPKGFALFKIKIKNVIKKIIGKKNTEKIVQRKREKERQRRNKCQD